MRRRVAATMLAAALTAGLTLLAAPGAAASGKATVLTASLSGAREVPGPGDPDGRGRAVVKLAGGKACYVLRWSGISAPTAAHIHTGRAGVAGPVAVLFFDVPALAAGPPAELPPTVSAAAGCVDDQDPAVLRDIRRQPRAYYVNVHTREFPGGAIRGQLRRAA